MALAKPVVVTRTAAIETGYGLEDGDNVRLVGPGGGGSLGRTPARLHGASGRVMVELLGDRVRARALGVRARATVEGALTWQQYVGRIDALLGSAALARPPGRRTAGYRPLS